MSGPPQSQHSPRSTVPSALLTIINLHPTLPWHTEACMEGLFTACVLQCTSCVWGSSNLSFFFFKACLNACVNMCVTHHLVGAWRPCLLAGLNCLIVLIVLHEEQREMISRVDRCLDTSQGEGLGENHEWSSSFLWIKRRRAEILEVDCSLPLRLDLS